MTDPKRPNEGAGQAAVLPDPTRPKPFVIRGMTQAGRQFRPSDWSDRLAGIMSPFRPPGSAPASPLEYSPYVQPTLIDGVRCVTVDARIAQVEPLAYVFLINFARDNDLQVEIRD